MRSLSRLNVMAVFAAFCWVAAMFLAVLQLVGYSRTFATLPSGLTLGGVPVGGLTEEQAAQQLVLVYRSPLELYYRDQLILLDPGAINFQVDTARMLPEVNQFRSSEGFWTGFWDYLWLKPADVRDVPLRASYSSERLRTFLDDVAARYDRPGSPPKADAETLGFVPGEPGHTLDVDGAVSLIDARLRSPAERSVSLPLSEQTAVRPSFDTLAELVRSDIGLYQFPGLISLALTDLNSGRELVLNLANGAPVEGPIAYSGMSTIKIPIMTSFFARYSGDLSDDYRLLLQRSIDESANTATDMLMKTIGEGDGFEGTRRVTADMQRLGLANTYIAGLLDVAGAVLLPIRTPANGRTDFNTLPDPYNQTTAEDMGALTVMVYQCSQGGGALMAAFPGQFTPQECRVMIDLLTSNQVGPIFIAGGSSPDGVVAHKHGWDRLPLNNVADAALVFTPGGNYALTIFIHSAETMDFIDANRMMISVSRAIYNYFNWAD